MCTHTSTKTTRSGYCCYLFSTLCTHEANSADLGVFFMKQLKLSVKNGGFRVILPLVGLGHFQVNRSVGLQFYRVSKPCIQLYVCVCTCACACGSDPSLGQADWGGSPNPSYFPQISLGFPAALRSHSVIQNSLTRISGLGQTARLIRRDSMRQTPQKHNLTPSSLFQILSLSKHTDTHVHSQYFPGPQVASSPTHVCYEC